MSAHARILIVEDHPIFRKGLKDLIDEESDMEVCGEAEDVPEAKKLVDRLNPDMVIVDLTLKGASGLELIKYIHERTPGLPILVLSMHDEAAYAERALKAGARGYIMKQEMTTRVTTSIRQVLHGKMAFSDDIVESILGRVAVNAAPVPKDPVSTLSDRELEVFSLIGRGIGRAEMASLLNVSIKTIGSYREKIKEKLRIKSSPELVKRAVEWVRPQDG
jgi:DNA-binding NarL/FixJ family response regulator